jgi:CMP-N,N'-diacetyllegionaminic acid synthase
MKILITICARGGSKGIPGKNIRSLNGKPLIHYTIKVAQQFQDSINEVDIVLSTDSAEIAQVAEISGLKTAYTRPPFLAGDSAGKIEVIKDVLLWKELSEQCRYDYILDLDVTSPLRNLKDLTEAFGIIRNNEAAINLFSVNPANRSPYFNMVEQKQNGFYSLVKLPGDLVLSRQSAPKVYDLNASFYFYKRVFFDLNYQSAVTDRSTIYVVPHICFDLDHPIDFEIISCLIEGNKLDFIL